MVGGADEVYTHSMHYHDGLHRTQKYKKEKQSNQFSIVILGLHAYVLAFTVLVWFIHVYCTGVHVCTIDTGTTHINVWKTFV